MVILLSPALQAVKDRVEAIAADVGLEFDPVIFEMVDNEQMNHIAAYGGFPTRYPHWRFGMEFEKLTKSYRYGLSRIYEMVVNTNPVYAYLLNSNTDMDQKLVMAHVYGHADFFRNNIWFSHTNRKMMDETANHATRIRRHIQAQGLDQVEEFIDACLSLEDLIDPHSPFIRRRSAREEIDTTSAPRPVVPRLKSKDYMESFINPEAFVQAQEAELRKAQDEEKMFPSEPQRDVLEFLLEHAPLRPWQRDVLSIIREEAYYFSPQMQTKIMNEGWASYWHSKLMTEKLLLDEELIDYADHHSGTVSMQPGKLNPYKIGIELFRDIEDRWNRGRFGKEYDECEDFVAKRDWDLELGQGREKIFEVRRVHNDVTFIDTFLTEEFCRDQKLFTFSRNERSGDFEVQSREFAEVKKQLLFMLTNAGRPFIYVQNANFANRGELCLWHRFEGVEIKRDYAEPTLQNLARIWGRPVHLETVFGDKPHRMSCEDGEIKVEEIATEE